MMCARSVDGWSSSDGGDYYSNLKIVGVGGGGCKAIEHMISDSDRVKRPVGMATFIAIDTDKETLGRSEASTTLLLENEFICGQGCSGNPTLGRDVAIANRETLQNYLSGTEVLFIVASLGGGTGSGVTPVLAEIAREMNISTVAVVTLPCSFEGAQRDNYATVGKIKLYQQVPTIIIPNGQFLGDGVTPLGAFAAANDRQLEAIRALAEMINPDITMICSDVDAALSYMSMGLPSKIGIGFSSGDNRAEEAAKKAIDDLKPYSNQNKNELNCLIFNIAHDPSLTMDEFDTIINSFKSILSGDLIPGMFLDPRIENGIRVTAIASYSPPDLGVFGCFGDVYENNLPHETLDSTDKPD